MTLANYKIRHIFGTGEVSKGAHPQMKALDEGKSAWSGQVKT
jgi:hypothetical protein